MSKLDALRKQVARDGIVMVLVLGALGGGVFALSTYSDAKEQERRRQATNLDQYTAQISELERKVGFAKESLEAYRPLKKKLDSGNLTIDREKAKSLLGRWRHELRLEGFRLEISPEEKFTSPEVTRFSRAAASYATIKANFTALSDLQAYAFLDRLHKNMPGYVFPTSIRISQQSSLGMDVLRRIRSGDMPPLVNVEIAALWIGIHVASPDAAAPAPPVGEPR